MSVASYWTEDKVQTLSLVWRSLPIPILATGPNASCVQPSGPSLFPSKPSPQAQHTVKFLSHCKVRGKAESIINCIKTPSHSYLCHLKLESSHHWLGWINNWQHRAWAAQRGPAPRPTSLGPSEMRGSEPSAGVGSHRPELRLRLCGSRLSDWDACTFSWGPLWSLLSLDSVSFLVFLRGNARPGIGLCLNWKRARSLWEGLRFGLAGVLPDDALIADVLARISHCWVCPHGLPPTLAFILYQSSPASLNSWHSVLSDLGNNTSYCPSLAVPGVLRQSGWVLGREVWLSHPMLTPQVNYR